MEEVWKPIPEYASHYEASSLGRIRRTLKYRVDPGVLRQCITGFGYAMVTLCVGNVRKKRHVHRLVLSAFVGPMPRGIDGCHEDGDRLNNRIENLRWDTREGNMADARRHGTTLAGEKNRNAKLTEEKVLLIRADQRSQYAIAKDYGVDQSTISDIKRRKLWAHI